MTETARPGAGLTGEVSVGLRSDFTDYYDDAFDVRPPTELDYLYERCWWNRKTCLPRCARVSRTFRCALSL